MFSLCVSSSGNHFRQLRGHHLCPPRARCESQRRVGWRVRGPGTGFFLYSCILWVVVW